MKIASRFSFQNSFNIRYYLIPVAFFVALLPFAATLVQYYADEWHYIDSVLLMLQNGDYLTPQNSADIASGISNLFRFNKPILTYWAVLAGFKIFGINVFSFRIFFLLAGALTLVITGIMAQMVFAKRAVAELAILILITLTGFLLASVRAIPDILLVMFLTLSAYGAYCLLAANDRYRTGWWCLYLGAALAFESKGLLAFVFLVYCLVFIWIVNPQIFTKHRLAHLSAALVAFILGAIWYIAMWHEYGQIFLQAFFHDQIGSRIHHSLWLPLVNIPLAALTLAVGLLPWSAVSGFAIIRHRQLLLSISPLRQRIYGFVAGWTLFLISIIGFGGNISSRYLLPLAPLWAIVIADIMVQINWEWRQRLGEYLLRIIIALLLLAGILNFLIIGQVQSITTGLSLLLIFLSLALWLVQEIPKNRLNFLTAAAWMMFFLFCSVLYPISILMLPDQAQQIVVNLTTQLPGKSVEVDFLGHNRLASHIRLLSQGRVTLHRFATSADWAQQAQHLPLIIPAAEAAKLHLPEPNQQAIVLSHSLEGTSGTQLIWGMLTWKLTDQIKRQSKEYLLIRPVTCLSFRRRPATCSRDPGAG